MRKFVSPNQSNSILEKLNNDRGCNKTTCDIQLKCGDKIFHAHKNVLSMVSDYFKKLFYTEMKEKYQEEIEVREITANTFEKVLSFIYTAEITISDDNVFDLLSAANFFLVQELIDFCCSFIINSMDCNNAVGIWLDVHKFDIAKLNKACRKFVTKHFADLNDSDTINSMDQDTFKRFITKRPKSAKGEERAFQFTVAWVKHNLEERKHLFPQLFCQIRLKLLSNQFIAYDVANEELIQEFKSCTERVLQNMKYQSGAHPRQSILTINQNATKLNMLDVYVGLEHSLATLDQVMLEASFTMYKNYLYMIGGSSYLENITNSVLRLDVRSPNMGWEKQPSLRLKRRNAVVAVFGSSIFVFGGNSRPNDTTHTWKTPEKIKPDDKKNKWVQMANCQKAPNAIVACKDILFAMHYGAKLSCEKYNPVSETSALLHALPKSCVKVVVMDDQLYTFCKVDLTLRLAKYDPESGESHAVSEICDVGEFRDACAAHGKIVVSYESSTKNKVVRVYAYNFEDEKWKFVIYSKDTSEYWKLIPYHTKSFE